MEQTRAKGSGKVYDLVIVGGGSAAFAAAIRANDLGASTLIVNEGLPMGGTCVNVGCVPSKALIRAAENHHWHGLSRFRGLKASGGRVDFPTMIHEKDDLIAELRREKYADILNGLPRVEWLEGRGSLRGAPGG